MFSCLLSTFSQILLKKSAQKHTGSIVKQYINIYVIGGYFITVICMLLTVIAYRGMPYKYGSVIESFAYFYIMIFGRLLLGERLTKKKVIGNGIIIFGVIIFSLGS